MFFRRRSLLFLICAFSLASLFDSARADYLLVLTDESGKPVLEERLNDDERFAIRYTHSVALSPVIDYFVVEGGDIYIDETVYEDFGAGLPHEEGAGQKMTVSDGKIILSGLKRKISPFELRVGRVANHVLLLPAENGERVVPLDSLAKPGSALKIEARPI